MSHWFILLFREKKHIENHKYQWAQIWRICHWCLNRSRVTSIWLYFIKHTANNCVQNVCQWRKKAYKWILSFQPLKDYISASTMSRSSDIKYLITKDLARKRYKSNISTTKGPKTTKICKEPTYYGTVSPIIDKKIRMKSATWPNERGTSGDYLITWSTEVMWYIKYVTSPLLQDLWLPNLGK